MRHPETSLCGMDDICKNHGVSMHDEAIMIAGRYRFLANASPIPFVKQGDNPEDCKDCPMRCDAKSASPKHKPPPCPEIVEPLCINLSQHRIAICQISRGVK